MAPSLKAELQQCCARRHDGATVIFHFVFVKRRNPPIAKKSLPPRRWFAHLQAIFTSPSSSLCFCALENSDQWELSCTLPASASGRKGSPNDVIKTTARIRRELDHSSTGDVPRARSLSTRNPGQACADPIELDRTGGPSTHPSRPLFS